VRSGEVSPDGLSQHGGLGKSISATAPKLSQTFPNLPANVSSLLAIVLSSLALYSHKSI